MALSIPAELKKITPYVRRAEELDKDKTNAESRLVAYYCRQYAVHTGIPLATSPAGKNCLGALLNTLENEKVTMDSFTRDEAKFLCRKFADKIFDKADLEDRTGESTKNTAKTFYAAASFLEILQQFYKDDDQSEEVAEIKKRAVYSKWKATEILKAIKEGRKPASGGYGDTDMPTEEEEKEEVNQNRKDDETPAVMTPPKVETVSEDEDEPHKPEPTFLAPTSDHEEADKEEEGTEVALGPPPAYPGDFSPPPAFSVAKPPLTFNPPPVPPPMPAPPTTKPQPPPPSPEKKSGGIFGFGKKKKTTLTKADFADAVELTKFAMAALDDKNADLAAERLRKALDVLGR